MVSSTRPPPPPYTPAPTSDNAANPTNDEAFFRALLTEVQQEQWNIRSEMDDICRAHRESLREVRVKELLATLNPYFMSQYQLALGEYAFEWVRPDTGRLIRASADFWRRYGDLEAKLPDSHHIDYFDNVTLALLAGTVGIIIIDLCECLRKFEEGVFLTQEIVVAMFE